MCSAHCARNQFCTVNQHATCQNRGDIYLEGRKGEMWELFGHGFYMKVIGLWYGEINRGWLFFIVLPVPPHTVWQANRKEFLNVSYRVCYPAKKKLCLCLFAFLYFLCVWGDVDVLMVQPAAKIRLRKWKELPCSKSLHFFATLLHFDFDRCSSFGAWLRKRAVRELQPHSDLKKEGEHD